MRDPYEPFQDELAAATPTPQLTPTDHELRQTAIRNCRLCDTDGYRGTTVCNHQDHANAAARGMNTIRQAMGWTKTTTTEETR